MMSKLITYTCDRCKVTHDSYEKFSNKHKNNNDLYGKFLHILSIFSINDQYDLCTTCKLSLFNVIKNFMENKQ